MAKTIKGNRPNEYKREQQELLPKSAQLVRKWRLQLDRAIGLLNLNKRAVTVAAGDKYIDGTKKAKKDKGIYLRYALPLLEDMHRRTLPRIPTPNIKARNQRAEDSIDVLRELCDVLMNTTYSRVLATAEEAQWDDSRAGVGFVRVGWETVTSPRDPQMPSDVEQIEKEIQEAQIESMDPLSATLAIDDIHEIHAQIHNQVLFTLDPFSQEYWALANHAGEHDSASVEVRSERMKLHRVPWYLFVYDPDLPWVERTWEAEAKSRKVQKLLDSGYRNINPENCTAEVKPGQDALPYEQSSVRVWEIHDKLTNELIVISRDGPTDGEPLFKGKWPYGEIDIYYPVIMRKALPEQSYGEATLQVCIPILNELATVDFYIQRHVRTHASTKTPIPKSDLIAAETKSALKNDDMMFVPISDKVSAMGGLKPLTPPPIPQTLLEYRNMLLSELRRVTGADAQDTGVSNPHKVTAQESSHREGVREEKKTDRQDIMGDMLAWCCRTFLAMYKKFGTLAITVRTYGPEGVEYHRVVPDDLPEGIDISFDIKGETEEAKANKIVAWQSYEQLLMSIEPFSPSNWTEVRKAIGLAYGISRPERFIADQAQIHSQPLESTNTQPVSDTPPSGQSPNLTYHESPQISQTA